MMAEGGCGRVEAIPTMRTWFKVEAWDHNMEMYDRVCSLDYPSDSAEDEYLVQCKISIVVAEFKTTPLA